MDVEVGEEGTEKLKYALLGANIHLIDIFILVQQLVKFLLKQASVDKRTCELFGN